MRPTLPWAFTMTAALSCCTEHPGVPLIVASWNTIVSGSITPCLKLFAQPPAANDASQVCLHVKAKASLLMGVLMWDWKALSTAHTWHLNRHVQQTDGQMYRANCSTCSLPILLSLSCLLSLCGDEVRGHDIEPCQCGTLQGCMVVTHSCPLQCGDWCS